MDLLPLILSLALLAALGAVFYLLSRISRPGGASDSLLIQQQIQELRQSNQLVADQVSKAGQAVSDRLLETTGGLTKHVEIQLQQVRNELQERLKEQSGLLQNTHQTVGQRLDNATKVVQEVSTRLGQMEESNRRIYEVGKDIASLQEILKTPKLRGGLGELFLGDLLQQILPAKHFQVQYAFSNGQKVDAALFLGGKIVPVDAKFPMDNFKRTLEAADEADKKRKRREFSRDVEKHIEDIASKYILPAENTFDFALMYIPAENVYYEIIIKDEEGLSISQAALDKRVIPVSPNSFYGYLQVILMGLKGLELESRTREILEQLQQMAGHLESFRKYFDLVGNQMANSKQNYDKALRELDRLDDRVKALSQIESEQPSLPVS